jgi:hypothetical protein
MKMSTIQYTANTRLSLYAYQVIFCSADQPLAGLNQTEEDRLTPVSRRCVPPDGFQSIPVHQRIRKNIFLNCRPAAE